MPTFGTTTVNRSRTWRNASARRLKIPPETREQDSDRDPQHYGALLMASAHRAITSQNSSTSNSAIANPEAGPRWSRPT